MTDQRTEVDQLLREIAELEAQIRQEGNRTVTRRAGPPEPYVDGW
jgi:hypothetical protein